MCTVSFIAGKENRFLLSSNRDEAKERGLASTPQTVLIGETRVMCPVDPLATGTWIAAGNNGDVVCLLNGAFSKHRRTPPYRMSRGLVVLGYFQFNDPEKFAGAFDLGNIEPFTLVMVHRSAGLRLFELRWDGNEKHFRPLDETTVHLWSSATLYNHEVAAAKKQLFLGELKQLDKISPATLLNLHQKFLYEDWVKPPERVEVVSTLSITCVEEKENAITMHYRDLVKKDLPVEEVELKLERPLL
jgi:hypothetical protein